ncbi:MAG: phosphoribosylamine--glycine ligase, partial [Gammaproteobacteria bacterium]|nr:phosphoribosylamine--glycine ligase [Gammaproteobacteria bacterium]
HALAWKVAQGEQVEQVFVAPGNAGTDLEERVSNVAIGADDIDALAEFAARETIDLTIVGPEAPLVAGIVDYFRERGLPCFGPTRAAARLEGSKAFCKDFLKRHGIPTAAYEVFTDLDDAVEYVQSLDAPLVIKADGLAAGKGVVVAQTRDEALTAVREMLAGNRFGEAGHRVVIEEFLPGEEASFIVMCDGQNILPLASSQDHKARDDGDRGPNTGGMGAYSPAPVITDDMFSNIISTVIRPTIDAMANEGMPYTGFLYAGLMIGEDGTARVLEYNCRFGDPETQPILMRLQGNLSELCRLACTGELNRATVNWDKRCALGVVLAAGGYPGTVTKGDEIHGLEHNFSNEVKVFHAGTVKQDQKVLTNGGRVLCVTALGENITEAHNKAYNAVELISWDGMFYRTDIGNRAINRQK